MKLEILLLGRLFHEPATGYELKRYLDTSGRFLRSNTTMSQVYRTLSGMEAHNLVSHSVEPRPGASDIKRYTLTEEGVAALEDWMTSPYNPPSRFQDPDLAARLSMAGHLGPAEIVGILTTEIDTRLAEIARYRNRERPAPAPREGYDAELARAMGDWWHRHSSAEMDRHVAALIDLRSRLLDGRPLIDEMPAPATRNESSR